MPGRRFRRGRDGAVKVALPSEEVGVLRTLAGEMAGLMGDGMPDEVRERLFPPAYRDDAAKDAEFRRLMAGDLEERKAADLATLRATLERHPLELSAEEASAWLGALQDMRLTLGTLLGIEEDGWESEDMDDPQFAVLHYLGFLQDSLVQVLM